MGIRQRCYCLLRPLLGKDAVDFFESGCDLPKIKVAIEIDLRPDSFRREEIVISCVLIAKLREDILKSPQYHSIKAFFKARIGSLMADIKAVSFRDDITMLVDFPP